MSTPRPADTSTISDLEALTLAFNSFRSRVNRSLGTRDLLDAIAAAQGDPATGERFELAWLTEQLWCKSTDDVEELQQTWVEIRPRVEAQTNADSSRGKEADPSSPTTTADSPLAQTPTSEETNKSLDEPQKPQEEESREARSEPKKESQGGESRVDPVTAAVPDHRDRAMEAASAGPVPRAGMIHAWRRFRRPGHYGAPSVIDIPETVRRTADRGFFLEPVLRRRERNDAELLMLVDQEGSMAPFHWLTRDLVAAAVEESGIANVRVFYFHDVFQDQVFQQATLREPVSFDRVLASCRPNCGVLIVSDAGAARGSLDTDGRIVPTLRLLARVRRKTRYVAWLNPMPAHRWEGSSARYVAVGVPMLPMTKDGLNQAIAYLRGSVAKGGRGG
ncbi:VWA domain-containing protein [Fimbriimonas ginsengisoli]|uniref:VWA containing CoxE family protein n=1 Tax=Fimbriimonas ginsengisoli Gsoil 348 TaxID=661478 RepID=A0A068NJY5_FIMGI|nr:VWA domain-containing protein [Fimbriimonas ginsengisoli]AIE83767.1 VWA containing CoxE family protein [Fimbriimonas ginsengisoli Gsoil 348]